MHRRTILCALIALLAASSALAISPSDDLLIAAAARTNRWTADLYIVNPGTLRVDVEVMWLERGQSNTNPVTEEFEIAGGETLILDDVLFNTFGKSTATGALRIRTTGGVVTANLVVFTGAGSPDGTYGSGFEAIPASSATMAGESTTLSGAALNDDFYTNLFALAGASGVTMAVELLDPDGSLLDTTEIVLEPYEPWLAAVSDLWDVASFDNGTAHVVVDDGSMVMLGSKIDRLSKDPTTLEQEFGAGAGSVDGIYEFTIRDGWYLAGGELGIENGDVIWIDATYMNWQKVDGQDDPECPITLLWGDAFTTATAVGDFATGVEIIDAYYDAVDWPDGGNITWTVTFTVNDNVGFSGTISAVGDSFTGADVGCNGEFPTLELYGGKEN